VFLVPVHVLAFVSNEQENPTRDDEEYGEVAVVNEEGGLAGALEPPVHAVSAEEKSGRRGRGGELLGVTDLVLNGRRDESFGLVADLFVGRCVVEHKHGPKPDPLV
jgi:hypothetical protein